MTIRIGYDGKTIDPLVAPQGLDLEYVIMRDQNRAGSGMIETINSYAIIEGFLNVHFTEALYRAMLAWWSWASQGLPWSLAMDTAAAASTTLDDAAPAGQKVIPLTDTTGFAADGVCLIRSADRFTWEAVTIDSVSAGVSITAAENLKFSYVAGALFRHLEYIPNAICLDDKFRPTKRGAYYEHTCHFIEEVETMPTARRVGTGDWGPPATLTISGGILTVPGPGYYLVATEGAAASDDLDQIQGLSNGQAVLLGPADGAKTVVIKNGTYMKTLSGVDFSLDDAYDLYECLCVGSNICKEQGRSQNE